MKQVKLTTHTLMELVEGCRSQRYQVRVQTLQRLEAMLVEARGGGPRRVPLALVSAMSSDPEVTIRDDAMELIGRFGGVRDARIAHYLMKDESWIIRSTAVCALAALQQEKAIDSIMQFVERERHKVAKAHALLALRGLVTRTNRIWLEKLMGPKEGEIVRIVAAERLADLGNSKAFLGEIEQLKGSDDVSVDWALGAIGRLQREGKRRILKDLNSAPVLRFLRHVVSQQTNPSWSAEAKQLLDEMQA